MKRFAFLLAAVMCAAAPYAPAQSGMEKRPESTTRTPPPVDNTPTDPGAVITPPRTGTEEIVKTPDKAVDPRIDDATTDIDRRNRRKSEQKSAR